MFKPTEATTPRHYTSMLQEPRRTEMEKIHEFILKTVPKLKPFMLNRIIGYGPFHYKYASGKEGDWAIIALASQKNYISIYVCSVRGDKYIAENYVDKLPKASIGKSCIRFKKFEDIDFDALKEILLEAEKLGGAGEVKLMHSA